MCLACEFETLWYAEWDRLGAGVPGTADPVAAALTPVPYEEAAEAGVEGMAMARSGSPDDEGGAAHHSHFLFSCEEAR